MIRLSRYRPLLLLFALAVYYATVVAKLQGWIDATGVSGVSTQESLDAEVQAARSSESSLDKKIQAKTETLKGQFGTLRLTGERYKAPLDALVNSLEESCRELGITLWSLTPMARSQTGVFDVEGIQCRLELPSEVHVSRLVNALREKGRSRNAMVHALTMTKSASGVQLVMTLSILRKRAEAAEPGRTTELEAFLNIQLDRAAYENPALLQPRPVPASGASPSSTSPKTGR